MKKWMCVGLALLVIGCGVQDNAAGSKTNTDEATSAAIAADVPLEIVINQFPASYFGRWGLTDADCIVGVSDAKGLISVQGSLVKFYESIATLRDGKRETLTSVSGNFDMVGEGQEWETHNRYQLSEDRQKLTRIDSGTGEKYHYLRCPA